MNIKDSHVLAEEQDFHNPTQAVLENQELQAVFQSQIRQKQEMQKRLFDSNYNTEGYNHRMLDKYENVDEKMKKEKGRFVIDDRGATLEKPQEEDRLPEGFKKVELDSTKKVSKESDYEFDRYNTAFDKRIQKDFKEKKKSKLKETLLKKRMALAQSEEPDVDQLKQSITQHELADQADKNKRFEKALFKRKQKIAG